MSDLVRCSVSVDSALFADLDRAVADTGAANRSEFIRSLLRSHLTARRWDRAPQVVATLTMTYDHHTRGLSERLVSLQHASEAEVLVCTHLHLSHHDCLEIIVVRGSPQAVKHLETQLRQVRGVHQVALALGCASDSAQATHQAHSHSGSHAHPPHQHDDH